MTKRHASRALVFRFPSPLCPLPSPLSEHMFFPLFGDADFGDFDAEVFADFDRLALAIAVVVNKQVEEIFARLGEGDECRREPMRRLAPTASCARPAAR